VWLVVYRFFSLPVPLVLIVDFVRIPRRNDYDNHVVHVVRDVGRVRHRRERRSQPLRPAAEDRRRCARDQPVRKLRTGDYV
jgi:hypothetical protein